MFSRGRDNEKSLFFLHLVLQTHQFFQGGSSESAQLAQNIRKKGNSTQVTLLYQKSWENVCSVLKLLLRYMPV